MSTARAGGGGGGGGRGAVLWYGICKYCSPSKQTSRDLLSRAASLVVSRAWRWRASPSSPLKLSRWQKRGREREHGSSPTIPRPSRRRGSAWTALLRACDFTPSAVPISLSWLPFHLHSTTLSALQPFICLCHVASHPSINPLHPAGQPAVTTPWVVAPRAAGAWGEHHRHDGGHRGKGRGSCHLYGSLPAPGVQDLACCVALVNASVGIPYHVRRASRKRSLPIARYSTRYLLFSHQQLHAAPSQRCGPAARLCMRE